MKESIRKRLGSLLLALLLAALCLSPAWSVSAAGDTPIYRLTVYADPGQWTTGGSAPVTVMQAAGTTYMLPTKVVRSDGYVFTGWKMTGSGQLNGNRFTFGTGEAQVYPNWERAQEYTVQVSMNTGFWVPKNYDQQQQQSHWLAFLLSNFSILHLYDGQKYSEQLSPLSQMYRTIRFVNGTTKTYGVFFPFSTDYGPQYHVFTFRSTNGSLPLVTQPIEQSTTFDFTDYAQTRANAIVFATPFEPFGLTLNNQQTQNLQQYVTFYNQHPSISGSDIGSGVFLDIHQDSGRYLSYYDVSWNDRHAQEFKRTANSQLCNPSSYGFAFERFLMEDPWWDVTVDNVGLAYELPGPDDVVRTGYTLLGWQFADAGTGAVHNDRVYYSNSTAKWYYIFEDTAELRWSHLVPIWQKLPEDKISVTIDDQIGVNLLLDLNTRNAQNVQVRFKGPDGTEQTQTFTDFSTLPQVDGLYKITVPVAPAQLAENISVIIDGEAIDANVKDYCNALVSGAGFTQEQKDLAQAVLDYGQAANDFFAYSEDTITNLTALSADDAKACFNA